MATNSQPAVGIAGVQAAARSSGSATRAGSKKFFLLAIRWAPLIGLLLALAFLWKDYASKTPKEKGDTPPATTSTQSMKAEAKWERMADGSIPVGVWSKWVIVGDCDFGLFLDEKHHARVRLNDGSIVNLTKSTHTNGVREISVMTEIQGETGYPIKFTCS